MFIGTFPSRGINTNSLFNFRWAWTTIKKEKKKKTQVESVGIINLNYSTLRTSPLIGYSTQKVGNLFIYATISMCRHLPALTSNQPLSLFNITQLWLKRNSCLLGFQVARSRLVNIVGSLALSI